MPPREESESSSKKTLQLMAGGTVHVPTKLREATEDEFVNARISSYEIKTLRIIVNNRAFLKAVEDSLKKKKPYEALRVPPEIYRRVFPNSKKLPRNLLVFRNEFGQLQWIVEFKSKLADQKKVVPSDKKQLRISKGGNRVVKYSMDLFTQDISAETIPLEERSFYEEADILYSFDNPYIIRPLTFSEYTNKRGEEVQVIVSPYYSRGVINPEQLRNYTPEQVNSLVWQYLLGVKALHDKGLTHNDIKPLNALLAKGVGVRVIDLDGVTKSVPAAQWSSFTPGYESPEMALRIGPILQTFNQHKGWHSLADDFVNVATKIDKPFDMPPNDVWALGIAIYQMSHVERGKFTMPSKDFINQTPDKLAQASILEQLAHGMLRPQRDQRFTIDDALVFFMTKLAEEKIAKLSPPSPQKSRFPFKGKQKKLEFDNLSEFVGKVFGDYEDLFWNTSNAARAKVLRNLDVNFKFKWENYKLKEADKTNVSLLKEMLAEKKIKIRDHLQAVFKSSNAAKQVPAFLDAFFLFLRELPNASKQQHIKELQDALTAIDAAKLAPLFKDMSVAMIENFARYPAALPPKAKLAFFKSLDTLQRRQMVVSRAWLPGLLGSLEQALTESTVLEKTALVTLAFNLLSESYAYPSYYDVSNLVIKLMQAGGESRTVELLNLIDNPKKLVGLLSGGLSAFVANFSAQQVQYAFTAALKQSDFNMALKIFVAAKGVQLNFQDSEKLKGFFKYTLTHNSQVAGKIYQYCQGQLGLNDPNALQAYFLAALSNNAEKVAIAMYEKFGHHIDFDKINKAQRENFFLILADENPDLAKRMLRQIVPQTSASASTSSEKFIYNAALEKLATRVASLVKAVKLLAGEKRHFSMNKLHDLAENLLEQDLQLIDAPTEKVKKQRDPQKITFKTNRVGIGEKKSELQEKQMRLQLKVSLLESYRQDPETNAVFKGIKRGGFFKGKPLLIIKLQEVKTELEQVGEQLKQLTKPQ